MTAPTQHAPLTGRAIKELRHGAQRPDRHLSLSCRPSVIDQLEAAGLIVKHGRPGDDSGCGCGFYIVSDAVKP